MSNCTEGNNLFTLPILDLFLIYAPLHFRLALVNHGAMRILKASSPPSVTGELRQFYMDIRSEPTFVFESQQDYLLPEFLGLITTRQCNLRCNYCGFDSLSAESNNLDPDVAISAINWFANYQNKIGSNTLELHFFGGEPSLAWNVIEIAVHYARSIAAKIGLIPKFEISTNGMLSSDHANFIGDYFDAVILSIDGPQHIHDRNRLIDSERGSFQNVSRTAELLCRSSVEICFRVCITHDTLPHMEELTSWLCDTYKPSIIAFETIQPTPMFMETGDYSPAPYGFAQHYYFASQLAEIQGTKPVYAADISPVPQQSFCHVGKDTLIVSPDRMVSSCYLPNKQWKAHHINLHIGEIGRDGRVIIDHDTINQLRNLLPAKKRCAKCFCRWSCAGGCHVNHSYPGCYPLYDDFCIQTRIISACSLLKELGHEKLINKFLCDRAAMEMLALQETDLL